MQNLLYNSILLTFFPHLLIWEPASHWQNNFLWSSNWPKQSNMSWYLWLTFFFPFSGMGINCWENANGSRHLTKEVRKKETTQQKASIWGNIHFISAAAESCPASAWKRERAGYSHSNAVLAQKPSSPLAQLVLLWAPQWGVGWVDSLLKPWLANFRAQTCPVPSVLTLADGNNADSTSMALSQELYHSVLFNRKCMSFFICLLASKLLELLTLFASFLFNFKN